jgi:hypothetical protein
MYMTQLEFKLYIERCREWVRERERERERKDKKLNSKTKICN